MNIRELILQDILERDLKSGETWSFSMYNKLYSKLSSDDKAQWSDEITSFCENGELEPVINGAFTDYKVTEKGFESVDSMATKHVSDKMFLDLVYNDHKAGDIWSHDRMMELYSSLDPIHQKYWEKGVNTLQEYGIIIPSQTISGLQYEITKNGSEQMDAAILKIVAQDIESAEKAIAEGDYFKAASHYTYAGDLNKQDAKVKAISDVSYTIMGTYHSLIESGEISESLHEYKNAYTLAYVSAKNLQNSRRDFFKKLQTSFSEADCADAVKESYVFMEGFLKSIYSGSEGIDYLDNEAAALSIVSFRAILNACVDYGDAIIDVWGDSVVLNDTADSIWKRILIDNSLGATVNGRDNARLESARCKVRFDPIEPVPPLPPRLATREELESAFEDAIREMVENNIKVIGDIIYEKIRGEQSVDITMKQIDGITMNKLNSPSIRDWFFINREDILSNKILFEKYKAPNSYSSSSYPISFEHYATRDTYDEYRITSGLTRKTSPFVVEPSPLAYCYANLVEEYAFDSLGISLNITPYYDKKKNYDSYTHKYDITFRVTKVDEQNRRTPGNTKQSTGNAGSNNAAVSEPNTYEKIIAFKNSIKKRYSNLKKPVKMLIDIVAMIVFVSIGTAKEGVLGPLFFYFLGAFCLILAVVHLII